MSISPLNGATGVHGDAKIVVTFSKPMDQAATQAAYQSTDLPASGVAFDWDALATVMTVKPNAPLEYAKGTTIATLAKVYGFKLTGAAKDTAGNTLAPLSSSFATLREITATLESEAERDGFIESNGYTNTNSGVIYVGDDSVNLGIKGFFSFDLSGIPSGLASSGLVSATLEVYKNFVENDPYIDLHHPCMPTICLTTRVVLDHVAYGAKLDGADYDIPALTGSGFIDSPSVPRGYTTADVLAAARDDITNWVARENRSQYRLSFPLISDGDGFEDAVAYYSGDSDPNFHPLLVLRYQIP